MPRLPNFFLVGAPKAGTTSLYHYLGQHPHIYMSAVKEPCFFAAEVRESNCDPEVQRWIARDKRGLRRFLAGPLSEKPFGGIVAGWNDYLQLFGNATNERALGEASVCYLWSPTAPARIAEKIPDARILVMLRNPVERAFSQYLHGLGNGAIQWTFREHIGRNLSHCSGQLCTHYPFLEFGLYAEQLGRYLKRFGHNVWVGFHEDFEKRPLDVLRNIFRFLGVDPEFSPVAARRDLEAQVPRLRAAGWLKRTGLWEAAARLTPSGLRPLIRRAVIRKPGTTHMNPEDRQLLIDYYRQDIRKLADLLKCDLDRWLQQA
jgi:hypothetical protein